MKKIWIGLLFLAVLQVSLHASEFRAGEISVKQIGNSSVEATIHLIIDIHADLENLTIQWGDGFISEFPSLSPEVIDVWGLKRYTIVDLYSYDEQGTYTISINECCIDDDVTNIGNPATQNFEVSTTFTLGNSFNTTPQYDILGAGANEAGQVIGIVGWVDDPEGDEYITMFCDMDASAYVIPDQLNPAPGNELTLSPGTGGIIWASPLFEGIYLAQVCTSETRNGVEISNSKRVVCLQAGDFTASALQNIGNAGFSIYPNPIQDNILWLHYDNTTDYDDISIQIFNTSQQLTLSQQEATGFESIKLDLTGWSAGVYFMLIEKEGKLFYEQLIVPD